MQMKGEILKIYRRVFYYCFIKIYEFYKQRAGSFFDQRISIVFERGNATSLLGTFPDDSDAGEYFLSIFFF